MSDNDKPKHREQIVLQASHEGPESFNIEINTFIDPRKVLYRTEDGELRRERGMAFPDTITKDHLNDPDNPELELFLSKAVKWQVAKVQIYCRTWREGGVIFQESDELDLTPAFGPDGNFGEVLAEAVAAITTGMDTLRMRVESREWFK